MHHSCATQYIHVNFLPALIKMELVEILEMLKCIVLALSYTTHIRTHIKVFATFSYLS